MKRLTKSSVESAVIKKEPYFIFDNQLKGFCIRVAPSGRRNYYLQYIKNKKVRRFSIGLHGVVTAKNARKEAVILLVNVNNGRDPQAEKQKKLRELDVRELSKRYMKEHVIVHCKSSTASVYQGYLRRHILPRLGHKKIREVTRCDIANMYYHLSQIPCEANHCLAIVSTMFNLAELWCLRPDGTNPCHYIKKYHMKANEHYLIKEEMIRLGEVFDKIKCSPSENHQVVYCFHLLLLTGCRLSEIQTLKWQYIDYNNSALCFPDSNTGEKIIKVSDAVINLLNEIKNHPKKPEDNEYVIWGRMPGTYMAHIRKPWFRFCKMAGINDSRIHNLRHSFASFAANNGVSLARIEKLLRHSQEQEAARQSCIVVVDKDQMRAAESLTSKLCDYFGMRKGISPENQGEPNPDFIKRTRIKAPIYFSPDKAAEYLGVSERTLEKWRSQRTGPTFVKTGGSVRYTLGDLEAFVQGRKDANLPLKRIRAKEYRYQNNCN